MISFTEFWKMRSLNTAIPRWSLFSLFFKLLQPQDIWFEMLYCLYFA
jgi:hypothetical protein